MSHHNGLARINILANGYCGIHSLAAALRKLSLLDPPSDTTDPMKEVCAVIRWVYTTLSVKQKRLANAYANQLDRIYEMASQGISTLSRELWVPTDLLTKIVQLLELNILIWCRDSDCCVMQSSRGGGLSTVADMERLRGDCSTHIILEASHYSLWIGPLNITNEEIDHATRSILSNISAVLLSSPNEMTTIPETPLITDLTQSRLSDQGVFHNNNTLNSLNTLSSLVALSEVPTAKPMYRIATNEEKYPTLHRQNSVESHMLTHGQIHEGYLWMKLQNLQSKYTCGGLSSCSSLKIGRRLGTLSLELALTLGTKRIDISTTPSIIALKQMAMSTIAQLKLLCPTFHFHSVTSWCQSSNITPPTVMLYSEWALELLHILIGRKQISSCLCSSQNANSTAILVPDGYMGNVMYVMIGLELHGLTSDVVIPVWNLQESQPTTTLQPSISLHGLHIHIPPEHTQDMSLPMRNVNHSTRPGKRVEVRIDNTSKISCPHNAFPHEGLRYILVDLINSKSKSLVQTMWSTIPSDNERIAAQNHIDSDETWVQFVHSLEKDANDHKDLHSFLTQNTISLNPETTYFVLSRAVRLSKRYSTVWIWHRSTCAAYMNLGVIINRGLRTTKTLWEQPNSHNIGMLSNNTLHLLHHDQYWSHIKIEDITKHMRQVAKLTDTKVGSLSPPQIIETNIPSRPQVPQGVRSSARVADMIKRKDETESALAAASGRPLSSLLIGNTLCKVEESPLHGFGLYASIDIDAHTQVTALLPQSKHTTPILSPKDLLQVPHQHDLVIDLSADTSYGRYINESFSSTGNNLYLVYEEENGEATISVRTNRKLYKGEELCISYGSDYWCKPTWHIGILRQAKKFYQTPFSSKIWQQMLKQSTQSGNIPSVACSNLSDTVTNWSRVEKSDQVYLNHNCIHTDTPLRVSSLNVNGMFNYEHQQNIGPLLKWMQEQEMDALLLQDTRVTANSSKALKKLILRMWPGAGVHIFVSTPASLDVNGSYISMGGTITILSPTWAPRVHKHNGLQAESSGLSLLSRISVSTGDTVVTLINVYLPPKINAGGPFTIQSRVQDYLQRERRDKDVIAYLKDKLRAWIQAAQCKGQNVILAGDFNGSLHGTVNHTNDLREWSEELGISSTHTQVLTGLIPHYATYYRGDEGISILDHVASVLLPDQVLLAEAGRARSISDFTDHAVIWGTFHIRTKYRPQRIIPKGISKRIELNLASANDKEKYNAILQPIGAEVDNKHLDTDPQLAGKLLSTFTLNMVLATKAVNSGDLAVSVHTKGLIPSMEKKKTRFLEAFSPDMLAYQLMINFFKSISWHMQHSNHWIEGSYRSVIDTQLHRFYNLGEQKGLTDALQKADPTLHPKMILTQSFTHITTRYIDHIKQLLRRHLHGRSRVQMRAAMSVHVRKMEELRIARKFGRVIAQIGLKTQHKMDLSFLQLSDGEVVTDSTKIHELILEHFLKWYSPGPLADSTSTSFLNPGNKDWIHLLAGGKSSQFWSNSSIPIEMQDRLMQALKTKADSTTTTLIQEAMDNPVTFEEFNRAIDHLTTDKAPGPSMATANMFKALDLPLRTTMYNLMSSCWTHKHIPRWWQDRLMCLAPKSAEDNSLDNMRPIALYEISRKLWTTIIIKRVYQIWEDRKVLNVNQHGFRKRQGTETAILKLLDDIEDAWNGEDKHILSWDVKRAFDSIPRGLLHLAWRRLGIPDEVANWLCALDHLGDTYPWTPHYVSTAKFHSLRYLETRDSSMLTPNLLSFKAERGIGQGDTLSTVAWIAIYDILLDLLQLVNELDTTTEARKMAYADDLLTTSSSNSQLQLIANDVSAFCAFSGLQTSLKKLQYVRATNTPSNVNLECNLYIIIRDAEWTPHPIILDTDTTSLKYLGIRIPLTPTDNSAFQETHDHLKESLQRLVRKKATPACKRMIWELQISKQILYKSSKASWPLANYITLDKMVWKWMKRILNLPLSTANDLLSLPSSMGGFGISCISALSQLAKWGSLQRLKTLNVWGSATADSLMDRMTEESAISTNKYTYMCLQQNKEHQYKGMYMTSLLDWSATISIQLAKRCNLLEVPGEHWRANVPAVHSIYCDGSYSGGSNSVTNFVTQQTTRTSLRNPLDQASAAVVWCSAQGRMIGAVRVNLSPLQQSLSSHLSELIAAVSAQWFSDTTTIPTKIPIYSDCKSVIKRVNGSIQFLRMTGGHKKQGILTEGLAIGQLDIKRPMVWTPGHPERRDDEGKKGGNRTWWDFSLQEKGIFCADYIAGTERTDAPEYMIEEGYICEQIDATDLIAQIIPANTWHWRMENTAEPMLESLQTIWENYVLRRYLMTRDTYRAKDNRDPYWEETFIRFAMECSPGRSTLIHQKQNFKTIYDKSIHGRNILKNSSTTQPIPQCSHCHLPDSQAHYISTCSDPEITAKRTIAKREYECICQSLVIDFPELGVVIDRFTDRAWHKDTIDIERYWIGTHTPATWLDLIEPLQTSVLSKQIQDSFLQVLKTLTQFLRKVLDDLSKIALHRYFDALEINSSNSHMYNRKQKYQKLPQQQSINDKNRLKQTPITAYLGALRMESNVHEVHWNSLQRNCSWTSTSIKPQNSMSEKLLSKQRINSTKRLPMMNEKMEEKQYTTNNPLHLDLSVEKPVNNSGNKNKMKKQFSKWNMDLPNTSLHHHQHHVDQTCVANVTAVESPLLGDIINVSTFVAQSTDSFHNTTYNNNHMPHKYNGRNIPTYSNLANHKSSLPSLPDPKHRRAEIHIDLTKPRKAE